MKKKIQLEETQNKLQISLFDEKLQMQEKTSTTEYAELLQAEEKFYADKARVQ